MTVGTSFLSSATPDLVLQAATKRRAPTQNITGKCPTEVAPCTSCSKPRDRVWQGGKSMLKICHACATVAGKGIGKKIPFSPFIQPSGKRTRRTTQKLLEFNHME